MTRHFSKENIQVVNSHRKRYSRFLIYQGNANENHNEIASHPVRMAIIKKNELTTPDKRKLVHYW